MIISQKRRNKAEEELEDAKEEFERKKEDDMKMMFMSMMGGNAGNMQGGQGQGFAYAPQQGLGAEEIRGIVSETMTAMLPNMQQYLPQQASSNDDLVKNLLSRTKS